MAIKENVFTFSESNTTSDAYQGRNELVKAMFEALIASPPAGWVNTASTLPTPTTSALQYDAKFTIDDKYKILLFMDSSTMSDSYRKLKFTIFNMSGTSLFSCYSANPIIVSAATGNSSINLTLTNYFDEDNFDCYVAKSLKDADHADTWGYFCFDDSQDDTPDIAIFGNGSSTLAIEDVATNQITYSYLNTARIGSDALTVQPMMIYDSGKSYQYIGKPKKCVCLGDTTCGIGKEYYLGEDIYVCIQNGYSVLLKI